MRRRNTFATNICCFRPASLPAPTKVNWFGQRCRCAAPARHCTIPGTRAPTPLAGAAGTNIPMAATGQPLIAAVTPMALELALAVQQEITSRLDEADRLRYRQVERAQYEADAARQRYMHVDPANRLVADALEADWNLKLRALADAQQEYQQRRAA